MSLDRVVSQAPSLREHTVAPAALAPFEGMDDAERALRVIVDTEPPSAEALAALASISVRRNRYVAARQLYLDAVSVDPTFAPAYIALAELAYIARDETAAAMHLGDALRLQRYFPDPLPLADRKRVVMLMRDATATVNAPLELLLDRTRVAIDKCYVEGYGSALPDGARAITAFGWWSNAEIAIRRARTFAPVNDPTHLERASRHELRPTLAAVRGVACVDSQRAARNAVAQVRFPSVVRPADTHAGRGLALAANRDELLAHVARFPADAYDVAPYVDYSSLDGYFRKYRIVLVGGRAYPYHLAVSPRWMVHYQSSPMREHQWMRDEEAAFLNEPSAVFPAWDRTTEEIASAIGLEYVGLDVARLPDGTMLVFEADPAMLVHDEEQNGVFAYKRPFVAAIREALMRLLS